MAFTSLFNKHERYAEEVEIDIDGWLAKMVMTMAISLISKRATIINLGSYRLL